MGLTAITTWVVVIVNIQFVNVPPHQQSQYDRQNIYLTMKLTTHTFPTGINSKMSRLGQNLNSIH